MVDEKTRRVDGQTQQELANLDREEWQDELFDFAMGLMRDGAIGVLLIVSAVPLIRHIGLVGGILFSLAAVVGLAVAGRRRWGRVRALFRNPGGPRHLRIGARKSKADLTEGDG